MMTGKAIARAVRRHLLVDAALNALILSDVLGVPLPQPSAEPHEVEETLMQQCHQMMSLRQTELETLILMNLLSSART